MPLSYRVIGPPAVEPITLAQAKQHLRVDFTDDDSYITALITAARQRVEKITNRAIFNQQVLLTLDYFPWPGWGTTTGSTAHDYFMHWYYRGLTILLPKPAAISVESVSYIANDGVTVVTIDPGNYTVDLTSEPARISPRPGYTWPYQQNYIPGQVQVTYEAGSYVRLVTESFQVPTSGPTAYALQQSPVTKIVSVVNDADGSIPPYQTSLNQPQPDGSLVTTIAFDTSLAGANLTVTYYAGDIPQTVVWAMLLMMKHLYDHREAASEANLKNIPNGVEELLAGEVFDTFAW